MWSTVGIRVGERGLTAIAVLCLAVGMVASLATGTAFAIPATGPGEYANLPLGYNYGEIIYSNVDGNVSLDTALPIGGLDASVSSWVLRYFKYYNAGGQIGRWGVLIPWARVSGDLRGTPISGSNDGFGDPVIMVTKTFKGAPALPLPQFVGYEQDTIVAGLLAIEVPLGKYDRDRILNIGTNRWAFKPEVAVSKKVNQWAYEVYGNVQFFTDNDEHLGSNTLEQDPLWGLEGHIIRDFKLGRRVSFDVLYALGGATALNGVDRDDKQNNFVIGTNIIVPVSPADILTLIYQTNSRSIEGSPDFDVWSVVFTHLW